MQVGAIARTDKSKLALIEVVVFTLLLLSYIWGWQGALPRSLPLIITLGTEPAFLPPPQVIPFQTSEV